MPCECPYDLLLLSRGKTHSVKDIVKAYRRIKEALAAVELTTTRLVQANHLVDQAKNVLFASDDSIIKIQLQDHDCAAVRTLLVPYIKSALAQKTGNQEPGPANRRPDVPMEYRPKPPAKPSAAGINPSPKLVASASDSSYRQCLEAVNSHFYKNKTAYFRCQWKNFDFITTENAETLGKIEYKLPLKTYLTSLSSRALKTLMQRADCLTFAIRRN